MKITEARLREMIRSVIREVSTGATTYGAQKSGYKSGDTKTKEADFDAKKADWETKKAAFAAQSGKNFRKAVRGGYTYTDGARMPINPKTGAPAGYEINPDYTTADSEQSAASAAKDSAEKTWNSAKASDLEKTVPKQKPPAGGRAGFGKGKTAGKAGKKGKKKKS